MKGVNDMKKSCSLILSLVLILFLSSTTSQAATTSYRIKASVTHNIVKGEKLKLYVKGYKKSKKVKWKSSKKKVAKVNKKGVVTGKKLGTATITARIGKKKYKTKVRVWSTEENIVYENDISSEPEVDRYSFADMDIKIPKTSE